jgi:hypothetical protein
MSSKDSLSKCFHRQQGNEVMDTSQKQEIRDPEMSKARSIGPWILKIRSFDEYFNRQRIYENFIIVRKIDHDPGFSAVRDRDSRIHALVEDC